jgi:hypothetical protein
MIPSFSPEAALERIVGQVHYHEEEARKAARLAIIHKLEIGRLLTQAKELLPHGAFTSWAEAEFGWSLRHCQRHMQLHAERTRVSCLPGLDKLTMRAALAAIAPGKQRERYMVVGYLDAPPGEDADAAALAAGVKDWKVRKA